MSRKHMMWSGVVLLVVMGLAVCAVWGQAPATAPATPASGSGSPPIRQWTMTDAFLAGSYIGFAIILLSVVMVALIVEHFMTINDTKLIPPDFVARMQELINQSKYQEAIELCKTSKNYIAHIMQAGLTELPHGYDAMVEAMVGQSEEESVKLNQKIGYLSLIGVIGPMMGLLGTVRGMMICFNTVANSQHGTQARDLAYGISQKLVCTFEGLCVAIPCMFFFNFFQDRVTNIGLEAGAVCEELIRRFKPRRVQAPPPAAVSRPAAAAQVASQPGAILPERS